MDEINDGEIETEAFVGGRGDESCQSPIHSH